MRVIRGHYRLILPRANCENESSTDLSQFNLTCIIDFRLFQNKRKPLSLQTWANIQIHKSLPSWAKELKINERNFIIGIVAPIQLKNMILIEWLSCERHNEYEYTNKFAQPDMACLYILNDSCKHASEKFFEHPSLYENQRYFSKTVAFYFYLLYLLETRNDHVFFNKLSRDIEVHKRMQNFLEKVCYVPRDQCKDRPLIFDQNKAYCLQNDYYINIREEDYVHNVKEIDCREWEKLKMEKNLKIFSA